MADVVFGAVAISLLAAMLGIGLMIYLSECEPAEDDWS